MPGIIQTADYARELLHLPSGPAEFGASEAQISRMIAARLRRQAILYETGRNITPRHVERYWEHTRLLLDTALTGHDAAALCRHISDETNVSAAT